MNVVRSGCYMSFIGGGSAPVSFSWIHSAVFSDFRSMPSSHIQIREAPKRLKLRCTTGSASGGGWESLPLNVDEVQKAE